MRILHVMPHYFPAMRYGGPIRSVHGLAKATVALGHDVHVCTTNIDGPEISDVPVSVPVNRDDVTVTYFPASTLGRQVFRARGMERALKSSVSSFDAVHIHYVWVWTTNAAASAARAAGVPYVLSPRGMLVPELIRAKSRLAKTAWLGLFDRKNVEGAAAVHVTTESEAASLRALGLKTRRIAVIANGTDPPPPATGEPAQGDAETPTILFLGRISWKKGLDRLIRALPRVHGADLVIAGYDEGGYQAEVERLVTATGMSGRVRFVGAVEGDDKWRLIRNAHVLVLPSYNENFGMSVVEAMAAGTPVVVTQEVGLAATVTETGAGLVTSGKPQPLAAALNTVLADAVLRARMGEAGRRVVEERFGWPGVARQMVTLYEECCAPGRLRKP